MSDKIYEVSPEWRKRAYIDDAKYREMYARSISDPNGFWASRPSASTGTGADAHQEHLVRSPRRIDQMVRGRRLNVADNCLDRHLDTRADQIAIIWEGETGKTPRTSPTRNCTTRSASSPTSCAIARQEGRPRGDLHADDSRGRRRDARLRAHRRDSFGRVRRVQRGFARRPHQRLRSAKSSSRRKASRGGSKRSAQGQRRRGASQKSGIEKVVVVKRNGGADRHGSGRDVWYHDPTAKVSPNARRKK